jgi:hypothetical protein
MCKVREHHAVSIALLAATGCANVSLQQYYVRVPPGTKIDIDPVGGYMLLYWVDASARLVTGAGLRDSRARRQSR